MRKVYGENVLCETPMRREIDSWGSKLIHEVSHVIYHEHIQLLSPRRQLGNGCKHPRGSVKTGSKFFFGKC